MKIRILITMFCFLGITYVDAQSLNKLMNNKSKNYKEISKEIQKDKKYLDNASKKELKTYNRWRWFWDTRVDSTGSFEKYSNAMDNFFNTSYPDGIVTSQPMLKSASTLSWESLGPSSRPSSSTFQTGRGRIRCIWIDPSDFTHIMIGANSGGLWETNNGGTNWNCLTSSLIAGGISDIAVHPINGDIYITTAMHINGDLGMAGDYSLGIFKSSNGGSSWTKLNISTSSGDSFQKIIINPTSPSIIYALSYKKVYKSTNSGSTWTTTSLLIPTGDDAGFRDILFKPDNPNILYVSGDNAIYKSTNAGSSWTDISFNLTGLFSNSRIAIATNPTDDDELYAFYINRAPNQSQNKIEKSEDGGNSWSVINSTYQSGVPYVLTLKLSPDGDIYLGSMKIRKSTDGGSSFNSLTSGSIHDDITDIEFPNPDDNDLVYVACDGGVYMDDAGGSSWNRINGNLATNEFYDVGILQGNSNIMVGGTHDCGTYRRDNNGNWIFTYAGDGGTSLYDQSGSLYYYSCNGSFKRSNSSSTKATLEFYNAPVCMDPTDSDILYYHDWVSGSNPPVKFKKSTNGGDSWITIDEAWDHVRDISICEFNTNYIFYTNWDPWSQSRIRRTTDGGAIWNEASNSGISSIVQVAPITCIYIHPYNPQKVWAVFGGFVANSKIFYSENGEDSWVNITGSGLPNLPIQCFEYDFLNQTMFVGTDVGIYYKSMDSNTWSYSTGFPRTIVSKIKLNKLTGDMIVSTYGRGIWSTNLGAGYCYDSTPLAINSSTTWSTNREVCKDVNVNSGTLKITADVTMSYKSTITIKSGATLEIDGGLIKNGNIEVETGGDLVIKNNGEIHLNNSEMEINGEMDFSYGEIDIKQ